MFPGHQNHENNHRAFLFGFFTSSYSCPIVFRLVEPNFWYLSRLWQLSHF
jgi:hypothetical protein